MSKNKKTLEPVRNSLSTISLKFFDRYKYDYLSKRKSDIYSTNISRVLTLNDEQLTLNNLYITFN